VTTRAAGQEGVEYPGRQEWGTDKATLQLATRRHLNLYNVIENGIAKLSRRRAAQQWARSTEPDALMQAPSADAFTLMSGQ
jgi:hypothetical protein